MSKTTEESHFDEYEPQTAVKHEVLTKYLDAWKRILGSFAAKLGYFDTFAGEGAYGQGEGSVDGSPIKVLKRYSETLQPSSPKLICFLTEQRPDAAQKLKQKVDELNLDETRVSVSVKNADFDTVIQPLFTLKDIIPCFFFIDPCGWTGFPMTTVQKLLSYRMAEVFINFMFDPINRFITNATQRDNFAQLYGYTAEEMDSVVAYLQASGLSGKDREKYILDSYISRLRAKLPGVRVLTLRVCKPGQKRTYFYLIHCSRHFKAAKVMKDVMFKASGENFNLEALSKQDSQYSLFEPTDEEKIETLLEMLLDRHAGQTLTFNAILEDTYLEAGGYVEKHYREALQGARKLSIVSVQSVSSATARGLKENDRVTFPAKKGPAA